MTQQAKLYVHCGFHKTGSTALQAALRASEAPLREAGFLYPYAGSLDRPGEASSNPHTHGHHSIGFELDRHWLFHPRFGTISDLAKEIGSFDGSVIISAEALESALPEPAKFAPFQALARQTGRRLTIVAYLRNQLSYCESLYVELLKHDAKTEYSRHAAEIVETGALRYRESLHQFDYERTLREWRQSPDIDVIVRNYHALVGGSIVADFAQVIGAERFLSAPAGQEKVNTRDGSYDSLGYFYYNRVGRDPTLVERLRIKHLAKNAPRLNSSAALQQKIIERFQASNLRLCETWGLPAIGLDMKDAAKTPSPVTLEQFFSFETQCAINSGAIPDASFAPVQNKQTGWMAGIETVGANVPLSETTGYWLQQFHRYRHWYAYRIKTLVFPRRSPERVESAQNKPRPITDTVARKVAAP